MKKLFLFLSFMFACALFVNAQPPHRDSAFIKHPPMHFQQHRQQPNFKGGIAMNRAKQMHKRLPNINYTKEQRAQLKTINEQYQKQLLQLQSNDAITLGEYKTKLGELKKDHKTQTQNILTDQQKQKIAVAKKNSEINRKVAATARLERLKLTLNLNDEQLEKIKQQQKDLQSQLKSVRENDNLLAEQKRDQVKQIMQQHKDDLKSVLTDEQKKILDEKKKDSLNRFRNAPHPQQAWGRK